MHIPHITHSAATAGAKSSTAVKRRAQEPVEKWEDVDDDEEEEQPKYNKMREAIPDLMQEVWGRGPVKSIRNKDRDTRVAAISNASSQAEVLLARARQLGLGAQGWPSAPERSALSRQIEEHLNKLGEASKDVEGMSRVQEENDPRFGAHRGLLRDELPSKMDELMWYKTLVETQADHSPYAEAQTKEQHSELWDRHVRNIIAQPELAHAALNDAAKHISQTLANIKESKKERKRNRPSAAYYAHSKQVRPVMENAQKGNPLRQLPGALWDQEYTEPVYNRLATPAYVYTVHQGVQQLASSLIVNPATPQEDKESLNALRQDAINTMSSFRETYTTTGGPAPARLLFGRTAKGHTSWMANRDDPYYESDDADAIENDREETADD